MDENIELLKAIANDTRMKIIQSLLDGEHCACSIVPFVGRAQPTVSLHLRILERAGVLESRREGNNIIYSIVSEQALKIIDILGIQKVPIETFC